MEVVMTTPFKPFSLNVSVTWKTPEDQKHWERDYKRLTNIFGAGPFTVEALYLRQCWLVVLKGENGTLLDRHNAPELFPASWLKEVEQGAA
jgi:hypothetical protein